MKTPSAKQRSAIYKEAKILLLTKEKRFICTAIRQILIRRYGCHIKLKEVESYFPEVSRRIPVHVYGKSRIHILTECEKEAEYSET